MKAKSETLQRILAERPPLHPRADGSERCIGLHSDALRFLYEQLAPGNHTLETGCGLSTVIFALAGCEHWAIVPNNRHMEATIRYAEDNRISLEHVEFVEARSEEILPRLDAPRRLDAILIDGGHAFPIPFIDWFYASQRLVIGGLLAIDDIRLKTVSILFNYLSKQPEWENRRIVQRTAFFSKKDELEVDGDWDYWQKQPFNKDLQSRFRQLWAYLRYRV